MCCSSTIILINFFHGCTKPVLSQIEDLYICGLFLAYFFPSMVQYHVNNYYSFILNLYTDRVSLPTLLCFSSLGMFSYSLSFQMHIRISQSISTKNPIEIWTGIAVQIGFVLNLKTINILAGPGGSCL